MKNCYTPKRLFGFYEQYLLALGVQLLHRTTRSLHRVTTRYVASSEFLAWHGAVREPANLRELPLIYGSVDHWLLVRSNEQQLVHAKKGFRIISGRAMRQAALAGLGASVWQTPTCRPILPGSAGAYLATSLVANNTGPRQN